MACWASLIDPHATAVSLLEPAVLVTMGLFLAAVLLSLYLPLFNVVQVVG